MRRLVSCAAALLAASLLTSRAEAQQRQAPRAERRIVCRGAAIPVGWILVDDLRDRTTCSGDDPAVARLYNVWAIERYEGRPVGTVILVCASTPTPAGWELVDIFRDPSACGHPTDVFVANVKRIRRVD